MCPPITVIIAYPQLGKCTASCVIRCGRFRFGLDWMKEYLAKQAGVAPEHLELYLGSEWVRCTPDGIPRAITPESWITDSDGDGEGENLSDSDKVVAGDTLIAMITTMDFAKLGDMNQTLFQHAKESAAMTARQVGRAIADNVTWAGSAVASAVWCCGPRWKPSTRGGDEEKGQGGYIKLDQT